MSTQSTTHRRPEQDDRQGSAGSVSHTPGQHENILPYEANPELRQRENAALASQFNAPSAPEPTYNTSALRQREQAGSDISPLIPNTQTTGKGERRNNRRSNQNVLKQLVKSKVLRGRSSLITLLLILFGGGGFLTVFLSPSLALVHMKEVFTQNLNDQLHAMDERSAILLRSKLKDVTKGSCGEIKIKCRFATLTDKQAEKFKAAGIIVEREPSRILPGRGQITKITYPSGQSFDGTDVKDMQAHLLSNVKDRTAMMKAYNPLFASLTDKVALGVVRKLKISRAPVITGETDEQRQKNLNDHVSGVENSTAKSVRVETDDDGKERYYYGDNIEITEEQYKAAQEQAARGENALKNGGTKGLLTSAVTGASIIGVADSACTVFNSLRFMSATAKTIMMAQAARFSHDMVLNPADSIKAGDAQEGTINFAGNNLATPYAGGEVLDESQLTKAGSAAQPAVITDPEAGMVAQDGPGYRIVAYGDAPDLSLRASRFMIGGGPTALFDGFLQGVSSVVNMGNPDPQAVSEKCGYIQNPVVRFGGLAIGIVAGIGTFGLSTALSIGGSIAFAMMLPYIEAQGAEMLAGNVFQDISGIDSGDAAAVGAVAFFGSIAKARGMKPASAREAMAYADASQTSVAKYTETQQYLARATPLDINNPYSFMGSLASTLAPIAQKSKSSASMAMMNITSLIPTAFASLSKSAGAASRTLDPDYYSKCNDIGYQTLGIGADVFCGVSYTLSEEELAMESSDIIDWMLANKQIDPDTGEATSGDETPDPSWSYAKYLEECPNRTTGWGENQEENEGNGYNCVDPAKETVNRYYRMYTFDKSVDESLDGEPVGTVAGGVAAAAIGTENGVIGADGWAFPVPLSFTVSSDYGVQRENSTHKGIDLASRSTAETEGEPIFAAYDGIVKTAGRMSGYGNWIVIEHNINGKIMTTIYGHMYDDGVLVRTNQTVKAGQQIGRVGSFGNSTGPHLHFEVIEGDVNGTQVDPKPYLEAARRPQEESIDV